MKFVIGDIHGEITKLEVLLKAIKNHDGKAELIFIGDYVDKGENALATLKLLDELRIKEKSLFLLGNHEQYWLEFDEKKLNAYGGFTTMEDCKQNSLKDTQSFLLNEFGDLFKSMILSFSNKDYLITHSGLTFNAYFKLEKDFTKDDVLYNRYDFLKTKQFYQTKKIVFGHTGFCSAYYDSFKVGIDTSACYLKEQPLTSLCLEEDLMIDSHNKKITLNSIPQNISPIIPRVKPYRIRGVTA